MKARICQSNINSFVEPTEGTCGIQELPLRRTARQRKCLFTPLKAILAIITTFITFIIFSDSYKWIPFSDSI
jgi:hypothetical protein